MRRLMLVLTAVMLAATLAPGAAHAGAPHVRIVGNQFVDGANRPLRLIGTTAGVGAADACVEPTYGERVRKASHHVFWSPTDDRQLALMRAWHMNAVRITLNEGCWLGLAPVRYRDDRIVVLKGVAGRKAASAVRRVYRKLVIDLVRRAHTKGFVTIVDLHYNAPASTLAFAQWPLPDRDHSFAFWRSVVRTFKADRSMVFEVFNEPYDKKGEVTWDCLLRGCRLTNACADCDEPAAGCPRAKCPTAAHPHGTFRAAGMQALVTAIREAGATQPVLVPGLSYSNDLSEWLAHRPRDRRRQLGATFHMYADYRYDNGCDDVACWNRTVARVARRVPVVTTEFGQFDCRHDVMDKYQAWADAHGVSYQAWGWYVADFPPCGNSADDPLGAPAMLARYDGTPTQEGAGYQAHLAALHRHGELP